MVRPPRLTAPPADAAYTHRRSGWLERNLKRRPGHSRAGLEHSDPRASNKTNSQESESDRTIVKKRRMAHLLDFGPEIVALIMLGGSAGVSYFCFKRRSEGAAFAQPGYPGLFPRRADHSPKTLGRGWRC